MEGTDIDMDSKFYEPEVLKQLQGEILSILDDFIRICEDYHLEYFGIAGTGIGALRHKGFIPWDDDIDIAMPRRDFERLLRIVEKKMSDRYLVLNAERYPNYPLMTTRLVKKGTVFVEEVMKDVDCPFGIFLDLYVLDNVADNPVLYQIQSWTAWFWSNADDSAGDSASDAAAAGHQGEAYLGGLRDGLQGDEAAPYLASVAADAL